MFRKFLIILLLTVSYNLAFAGSEGKGGEKGEELLRDTIVFTLKSEHFRYSLQNYLRSIEIEKVESEEIKSMLSQLLVNGIINDIEQSSTKYDIQDYCESNRGHSTASTEIGLKGANICWNINDLVQQSLMMSGEEMTIHLASIAFHEHIHHFQDPSITIEKLEAEAKNLASYFRSSARFANLPLLEWKPATPDKVIINEGDVYKPKLNEDAWFVSRGFGLGLPDVIGGTIIDSFTNEKNKTFYKLNKTGIFHKGKHMFLAEDKYCVKSKSTPNKTICIGDYVVREWKDSTPLKFLVLGIESIPSAKKGKSNYILIDLLTDDPKYYRGLVLPMDELHLAEVNKL